MLCDVMVALCPFLGALEYVIPHGIADQRFQVTKDLGIIKTNASLDREQQQQWLITGTPSSLNLMMAKVTHKFV